MTALDVEGGFDVHEYRYGLKLLEGTRKTAQLVNREGFACPACGEPFERLFVTEKPANTFEDPGTAFCAVRTPDELLVLTH